MAKAYGLTERQHRDTGQTVRRMRGAAKKGRRQRQVKVGGGSSSGGSSADTTCRNYSTLAVVIEEAAIAAKSGEVEDESFYITMKRGRAVPLVDSRTLFDADSASNNVFCSAAGPGLVNSTDHDQSGFAGGSCASLGENTPAIADQRLVMLPATSYSEGSVSVTAGVVTLTGGAWPAWVVGSSDADDNQSPAILVDGDTLEKYPVKTRDSDTQLTLEDLTVGETPASYRVYIEDNVVSFENSSPASNPKPGSLMLLFSASPIAPDSYYQSKTEVVGTASAENATGVVTLTWPAGIQPGDRAFLVTNAMGPSNKSSDTSGKTWLSRGIRTSTDDDHCNASCYVAELDGTETGTFNVTFLANYRCCAATLIIVRGVVNDTNQVSSTGTPANPISLSAWDNDYRALVIVTSTKATVTGSYDADANYATVAAGNTLTDGGETFEWLVRTREYTLPNSMGDIVVSHSDENVDLLLAVEPLHAEEYARPHVYGEALPGNASASVIGGLAILPDETGYTTLDGAARVQYQDLPTAVQDAIAAAIPPGSGTPQATTVIVRCPKATARVFAVVDILDDDTGGANYDAGEGPDPRYLVPLTNPDFDISLWNSVFEDIGQDKPLQYKNVGGVPFVDVEPCG